MLLIDYEEEVNNMCNFTVMFITLITHVYNTISKILELLDINAYTTRL